MVEAAHCTVTEGQIDAAITAAHEGISFEGFELRQTDGGYKLTIPEANTSETLTESALRERLASIPVPLTNWHYWSALDVSDAKYAFLRWLEDARGEELPPPGERYTQLADELERHWGELLITTTIDGDGTRRYSLRHQADATTPDDELTAYDDPLAAQRLAKEDDDGRYRPLKTAPTLQTGWHFPDCSAADLLETVSFFYPATVANWYAESTGGLEVTHWSETTARQTGIYDVAAELPRDAVDWAVEACCVDSQCLKRREWEYDEETAIDVPAGNGEFPCREPCSLLIAAARKWSLIEAEETEAMPLELAPSERDQLEELLDAVAEGKTDEIREADVGDGANRYRARYLRAKLREKGVLFRE